MITEAVPSEGFTGGVGAEDPTSDSAATRVEVVAPADLGSSLVVQATMGTATRTAIRTLRIPQCLTLLGGACESPLCLAPFANLSDRTAGERQRVRI